MIIMIMIMIMIIAHSRVARPSVSAARAAASRGPEQ